MTPRPLPDGLTHHRATINGIEMHYVEAGEGEPVLFLHGFPEFWYSWRHQIAELAEDYRVIAPDLRGYNETEDRGPYDTGTLQDDVAALIHHLGEESVHLVAHDWGGAIAWALASTRPELVRSLAVCNIPHPALFLQGVRANPRQLARSWYMLFFQVPWLPERVLAADGYRNVAKMLIRDCKPGTFTREDIKAYLAAWRHHGLGGGVNWYRAALRQAQPFPDPMPVIEVPVTMIWGDNDRALGVELTEGTEQYASDFELHLVPGASHWVQQEEPAIVNGHLRDHLARARGGD
jgi:pimeloyl-ACP methyl ester carboxylesterase